MKIHNAKKANHYEWETPQELFNKLDKEFYFNLDPCATPENTKCHNYFTKDQDGLKQDWEIYSTVFVNPPYGRSMKHWVKKCHDEWEKGCTVVMLIPVNTDTAYFHDYIYGKAELRFIRGRLCFKGRNSKGEIIQHENGQRATFPSMLVIFRKREERCNAKYV